MMLDDGVRQKSNIVGDESLHAALRGAVLRRRSRQVRDEFVSKPGQGANRQPVLFEQLRIEIVIRAVLVVQRVRPSASPAIRLIGLMRDLSADGRLTKPR